MRSGGAGWGGGGRGTRMGGTGSGGRQGVSRFVKPLDPGDGSLVHHPS
jgi:hypothetical protein